MSIHMSVMHNPFIGGTLTGTRLDMSVRMSTHMAMHMSPHVSIHRWGLDWNTLGMRKREKLFVLVLSFVLQARS